PPTEIAWVNAGKHPMQGTIAASGLTANALANSGQNTIDALTVSEDSTSNALKASYQNTVKALGNTARSVGKALRLTPKKGPRRYAGRAAVFQSVVISILRLHHVVLVLRGEMDFVVRRPCPGAVGRVADAVLVAQLLFNLEIDLMGGFFF